MSSEFPVSAPPSAVVGIGASAGGIEALVAILAAFHWDSAAFVVVTHLPKGAETRLPEVLQRFTVLEVDHAFSGTELQPNHIYIVPDSASVSLSGNLLVFSEATQQGPARNIDHFFISLAKGRGSRAIGVVLSGASRDGTLGLAAIRAAGGATFVQSPETALFASMPESAQESAQYSLEPSELGAQLMSLLVSRAGAAPGDDAHPA